MFIILIFPAIIVSAFITVIPVMGAIFFGHGDPWVVAPTVFVLSSLVCIIKPDSMHDFFKYERLGRLRVPPDNSDDTTEERISEKS